VAQTKYKLAKTTAARWQALAGTPAVSKQEVDVQNASAEAAKAEVEASEQDLARYAALEAFKRVVAPFDGVVTARLTDVGAYVNAAGGEVGAHAKSTELFSVADVHKLRVFVAVPQDYADGLRSGPSATIHLPSQPGKLIQATFLTTARAFDPNTRHLCRCGLSNFERPGDSDNARAGADFSRRGSTGRDTRCPESNSSAQRDPRAKSGRDGTGHEWVVGWR
jgi:multidrug efflux pump subunit AcrA (membrane-fusion protein)